MISVPLQKAREYEAQHTAAPAERPVFHVTPTVGWMNDPNGFSVYRGEYHLFYQYHPYSREWGPMHWGHVKSTDLIRWERLPAALAPDREYDRGGCFSGSAAELPDGRQLLVYTGVSRQPDAGGVPREMQTQCLAVGDGLDYEKCEQNPVISSAKLPEGGSASDFRDPKIWREPDGSYRLVVGNRAVDGCGAVLLYRSRDALQWEYAGTLDASHGALGEMWECPDCFRLDGKQVLMVSPQGMLPQGLEFHAGNNTAWLIGEMDTQTGRFIRERVQPVEYGIDFYAPQTLLAPDGRRIMIAWMQNWETVGCREPRHCWFGQMTLPRELWMEKGKILQRPVRELERYRRNRVSFRDIAVAGTLTLPGVSGRVLDMVLCVHPNGVRWFRLCFAMGGPYVTTAFCDFVQGTITLDRSRSGINHDILHSRTLPMPHSGEALTLRLVLDRFSVELFAGNGEYAASMTLHTPMEAEGICLESEEEVRVDIEKYDLVPDQP